MLGGIFAPDRRSPAPLSRPANIVVLKHLQVRLTTASFSSRICAMNGTTSSERVSSALEGLSLPSSCSRPTHARDQLSLWGPAKTQFTTRSCSTPQTALSCRISGCVSCFACTRVFPSHKQPPCLDLHACLCVFVCACVFVCLCGVFVLCACVLARAKRN